MAGLRWPRSGRKIRPVRSYVCRCRRGEEVYAEGGGVGKARTRDASRPRISFTETVINFSQVPRQTIDLRTVAKAFPRI